MQNDRNSIYFARALTVALILAATAIGCDSEPSTTEIRVQSACEDIARHFTDGHRELSAALADQNVSAGEWQLVKRRGLHAPLVYSVVFLCAGTKRSHSRADDPAAVLLDEFGVLAQTLRENRAWTRSAPSPAEAREILANLEAMRSIFDRANRLPFP